MRCERAGGLSRVKHIQSRVNYAHVSYSSCRTLGEGVVEAEIVAWHVKPGEEVRVDQPLVDVMTDKATVTIPSGFVGRVMRTHGNVGETVAVGSRAGEFRYLRRRRQRQGDRDERRPKLLNGSSCLPLSMSPSSMPPLVQQAVSPQDARVALFSRRPARRCGGEHANCTSICSMCTAAARMAALRMAISTCICAAKCRLSAHRRPYRFAHDRNSDGRHAAPHRREDGRQQYADSALLVHRGSGHYGAGSAARASQRNRTDGQPKLTYLPFIMLSVTRALGRFPQLNAHYDVKREVITRYEAVHLGIATQTDRGLCVPVVRHAETMDLWQAAREMRRITEAARNHSISRDELDRIRHLRSRAWAASAVSRPRRSSTTPR